MPQCERVSILSDKMSWWNECLLESHNINDQLGAPEMVLHDA